MKGTLRFLIPLAIFFALVGFLAAGLRLDPREVPSPLIDKFGADTVRTYVLNMGPPDQDAAWNDNALAGAHRLLSRLWTLADDLGIAATGPLASSGATSQTCSSAAR